MFLKSTVTLQSNLPEHPPVADIFFFEALCVASAIHDAVTQIPVNGCLAIYTDSLKTVYTFNTLSAGPGYNRLLVDAVEIILVFNVDFRVFHVAGEDNVVADHLSLVCERGGKLLSGAQNHVLPTSSECAGGILEMIPSLVEARQPLRNAWPMEQLIHECSVNLGLALDKSTNQTYSSALNSYITFCDLHHLTIDPTPDTHSLLVKFMSAHINLCSVDNYLSGIGSILKEFYPQKAQVKAWKASRKLSAEQQKEAEDVLTTAIQQLLADENEKISTLAHVT
ncbi:hypothetical protein DFJ58DRAFT_736191 [Suillus subalutaceus]|uniref:uncharacterized protein n=1 Tax=Suillus subalutaceus TaxID=48586 RepID=UPI001B872EB7|nr:uncharacterized protein DFJ58DRAFT_736191 [Suillus subalutaceus]KAG1833200.1 hypothetical protein DFJ58DRAFT_736191 [Suillus subalutaceus]